MHDPLSSGADKNPPSRPKEPGQDRSGAQAWGRSDADAGPSSARETGDLFAPQEPGDQGAPQELIQTPATPSQDDGEQVQSPSAHASAAPSAAHSEAPPSQGEAIGALWERLLGAIRFRMQPEQFATWFSRADLVRAEEDTLEIAVMNDFARDWIQSYHLSAVEAAITEVFGSKRRVIFTVDPELAKANLENQVLTPAGRPPASSPPSHAAQDPHQPTGQGQAERSPMERTMMEGGRPGLLWSSDVELHPRYTFENYVVGPCNRFGYAAAMGAAEQPGKNYNPFFLHGRVGVGKTHLLQAVCHLILQRQPSSRILYLSCETFINHFISALQDGDTTTFRNKYRYVDVLVVDDIHLLANKERTQEEFFHTFNTLYQAGKQIVLSSDSPPKDIPTLQDRLVSRFKWGMVTEIEPPCFETRMAIVKQKSTQENNEFPTVVAEYIASHFEDNVRELEGAVTRLLAFSSMTGRKVDMAVATEALSSFLKVTHGQPTLTDVVDAVSKHYRLKPSDLQSSKRTRTIAFPRHVAMYLARTVTSNSFETIGAHFGGRDHSSVVYAVSKITKLIKEGSPKSEEVGRLYTELTGRQMDANEG